VRLIVVWIVLWGLGQVALYAIIGQLSLVAAIVLGVAPPPQRRRAAAVA